MSWTQNHTIWPMYFDNATEMLVLTTRLGCTPQSPSCHNDPIISSRELFHDAAHSLANMDNWTAPSARGQQHLGRHDYDDQMVGRQVTKKVSIAFSIVLIPLVSVFGSVGNILSLRVLVHHRMRNSTNMLLAALAVSDLLVLLHALYFSFLRIYALSDPAEAQRLRALTFPLVGPYTSVVTARITTGLTTMLSVERLVAVYLPMKAKAMCSRFMTLLCIGLIFFVTTMAFIPTAMKYQAVSVSIGNQTQLKIGLSPLGKNTLFFLVYGNTLNVCFRLLPIVVLILVNIFIALAINKTWSFRRSMSGGVSASYEQNRITLMLLMVSIVFLVCILPGAIHSIMTQLYRQYSRFGSQSNLFTIFSNVTYFLETFNSSINFVIYMAYSTKFHRTYKQIFCCKRRRQRSAPSASTRSIVRFPLRPSNGSHSSMTSYRELHLLNHLRKNKYIDATNRNGSSPQGGQTSGMGAAQDQASGSILRKLHSKYSISESSYSNHSQSHNGQHNHSHSEHSHGSSSGHIGDRCNEQSGHSMDPSPEERYS